MGTTRGRTSILAEIAINIAGPKGAGMALKAASESRWVARLGDIVAESRLVGGLRALATEEGGYGYIGSTLKAVNLPSWKTVAIDMEHIASGHMIGGSRLSALKGLFPEAMNANQDEGAVRQAYRYGGRIATEGDRVLMRGQADKLTIELWVNTATRTIETAYPVFK